MNIPTMTRSIHEGADHDDFGGLHRDLHGMGRRRFLRLAVTAAGAAGVLAACGSSDEGTSPSATASDVATSNTTGATTATNPSGNAATATAGATPSETGGPFPGDGSNGPNVLDDTGVVRQDITRSFGDASGSAAGVPLRIALTVVDSASGAPLPGAAVYLWHCDRDGNYSIYSDAAANENYLRGVQVADADGALEFTTIYPGCYSGRWPHAHFEVFAGADAATSGGNATLTSQIAFPQGTNDEVYATSGYESSARNFSGMSLDTDNVFSDGYELELATVEGDASGGYTARLVVRV